METELFVATFDTMTGADAMLATLKDLQDDDFIELLDAVIVTKDLTGNINIRQPLEVGPGKGAAFGALTGAVVGLIAGPAGAIVGLVSGAVTGGVTGAVLEADLPETDIEQLADDELDPGESALLVYFDEVWLDEIEQTAHDLGAAVYHQILADRRKAEREQQAELRKEKIDAAYKSWQEKLDTQKAALTSLRQRSTAALQADRTALQQQIEQANHRIDETYQNILHRLQVWEQQVDANINALETQIQQSNANTKANLEQRLASAQQSRQELRSKVKAAFTSRLDHLEAEVDHVKAQTEQAQGKVNDQLTAQVANLKANIVALRQRIDNWAAEEDAAWDAEENAIDAAISAYWKALGTTEEDEYSSEND
ncbi:MAG: DUF1269 domain-containing protein [Chloroflexi bacterium]|nr:DUF1269 domain-containing protein [Chloroflexota bacterium]